MDKNELRAAMVRNGDNGETLANYLGIHRSRLSAKMNEYNGAEFTQREIKLIRDRYHLSGNDLIKVFFNEKVS